MVEPLSRLLPVRWRDSGGPDQVKPTSRLKCPSLRLSTPPPAQCTMNASRMMARITTTTQKKNTMMPGIAYPATVLALATAASYPPPPGLFSLSGGSLPGTKARRAAWPGPWLCWSPHVNLPDQLLAPDNRLINAPCAGEADTSSSNGLTG